jgi:hypothetical protein
LLLLFVFEEVLMRFRLPIEVSRRAGVATPGAIGVVILKVWVWAEAAVATFATRAATAMPVLIWRNDIMVAAPGTKARKRGKDTSQSTPIYTSVPI